MGIVSTVGVVEICSVGVGVDVDAARGAVVVCVTTITVVPARETFVLTPGLGTGNSEIMEWLRI